MEKIKSADFRAKHLSLGDVWAWSTDLYEPEDSLVTIPLTEDALVEAGSLLLRASFETPSGDKLEGLVMYSLHDQRIFAIEILDGDRAFTFNKALPDWAAEELDGLAAHLQKDARQLMPMRYAVVAKGIHVPSGSFAF